AMLTRPLRAPKTPDESGFGPQAAAEAPGDAPGLHGELSARLSEYRAHADTDPFSNPILRMALELTRLSDRSELSSPALEDLVRHMTVAAYVRRAERLRAYIGEVGMEANEKRLRDLITRIARSGRNGQLLPFQAFQPLMERFHYGVVFTAHPTFSLPH